MAGLRRPPAPVERTARSGYRWCMNLRTRRVVQVGTGIIAGLVVAGVLALPSGGSVEDTPDLAPRHVDLALPLTASSGDPTTLAESLGSWNLLFFGFTHCPDVCPVTLQRLAAGLAELDRRGVTQERSITVTLATVDPDRDSPEVLREYLEPFGPRFVGVTGSTSALAALQTAFDVIVKPPEPSDHEAMGHGDGTTSEIAHTAKIHVLDPEGRWVGDIPPWPGAQDMADALDQATGGGGQP